MSLWGANSAAAADKPKFAAHTAEGDRTADVTGYVNVAIDGAIVQNPGWTLFRQGTGPVLEITITDGGVGYANGESLVFTANTDNVYVANTPTVVDAVATVTTDANGTITAVDLTSGGSGYTEAPDITITTVGGSNAVLTATMGGRAGRVTGETLVALSSMRAGGV